MTNTQIAAQPYCFSSASSLASSTVSTWEDWKLRCFHSFAPFMKLLPKQPHRKKKRAMCCRGVLICTQTYEPVQLYRAEGGGMSISFLFLSLLSSTHTVHASLFLHTRVFSLSVTHTYNICMQSHRDIIELCLGLPGQISPWFTRKIIDCHAIWKHIMCPSVAKQIHLHWLLFVLVLIYKCVLVFIHTNTYVQI